jgi:hypothetical protein
MYETQSTVQGLAVMIISMIYEDIHRINLAYQEKISLLGTQLYSQIFSPYRRDNSVEYRGRTDFGNIQDALKCLLETIYYLTRLMA